MERSVRCHQQHVVARRVRILLRRGAWTLTVPACVGTHRLEHEVERGRDLDLLLWPDFKRPHN
jgi:hypothetical protein